MSLAREINERFTRIERILDTLKTNERGGVSGGAVPAPNARYEHLEADAVPSWQPVVNLTLVDDALLHFGPAPGASLEYDAGNAHLQVTGAPVHIAQRVGVGAQPDGSLSVVGAQNPLLDLDDPTDYQLGVERRTGTDGAGVGISFYISSDPATVGAAIIHEREDAFSKGSLGFYTKRVAAAATDPVLALTLDSSGNTNVEEDLSFTTGRGITHADGVVAGMVLRADGTRYVPAVAAATLPIAPLAVGDTLIATAGPVWGALTTPGAAGYARVSTATTEVWSQTPTMTGDWTWASATTNRPLLTIENTNADAQSPAFVSYKNSASPADNDELGEIRFFGNSSTGVRLRYAHITAESLDVTQNDIGGGLKFIVAMNQIDRSLLELSGYNGVLNQGEVVVNQDGQDVDFRVEASGVASALTVQGSDGHVGILTAPSAVHALRVVSVGQTAAISGDETTGVGVGGTSSSNFGGSFGSVSGDGVFGQTDAGAAKRGVWGNAVNAGGGVYGSANTGIGGEFASVTGIGLVANLTGAGIIAEFRDNGTPVLTVQDGGQADFAEYLRHLGDTNTYRRLRTDQITDVAGGITFIDAVAATSTLTLGGSGVVVPDDYTIGFGIPGSGLGRIQFDDQATDEILFLSCNVGMGVSTPTAKLSIDQSDSAAAIPVISLDQADVNIVLAKITATAAAASANRTLVADSDFGTPGALVGWIQIEIEDVGNRVADGDYYIPFYATPT